MNELPTGTVTFLFTDIEGSTARGAAGEGSVAVLAEQADPAKGGRGAGGEIDNQGDRSSSPSSAPRC